jgi:hypothetical protein
LLLTGFAPTLGLLGGQSQVFFRSVF